MTSLNELIALSGYKKEHLIKKTGIPRNKFYKALKDGSLLSDDEVNELALALGYNSKVISDIIDAGNKASGLHH